MPSVEFSPAFPASDGRVVGCSGSPIPCLIFRQNRAAISSANESVMRGVEPAALKVRKAMRLMRRSFEELRRIKCCGFDIVLGEAGIVS